MTPDTLIVQEPEGARVVRLPLHLGGDSAVLKLPVVLDAGPRIDATGAQWWLRAPAGLARVNGRAVHADTPLVSGDAIDVGGAQLVLRLEDGPARLGVYPLRGNETVAPLETPALPGEEVIAGTREIRIAETAAERTVTRTSRDAAPGGRRRYFAIASMLAVVASAVAVFLWMVPVPLVLSPAEAVVSVETGPSLRLGDRIFIARGERQLEVGSPGFRSERRTLQVGAADVVPQRFSLQPLPGLLRIDTGGLVAEVLADGEVVGRAPGVVELAAGSHDLLLRAPRHLDGLVNVEIAGRGEEQPLAVTLEPAWGWLEVDARPAGAHVFIDGIDRGPAPQRLELDSGLHELELRIGGRRGWRSQVAIVAGQTLSLAAVDLTRPAPPVMPVAAAAEESATAPSSEATATAAAPTAPSSRIQSPLLGSLLLVQAGQFQQGSDRREQGRRSNETLRTVTLTQPFYLAEREVTNGQFREFRAAHASGVAADRTLDLDGYAVSGVTWDDAVAFCNWLSQREGLPLAYERRDGRWQLVAPHTQGYRLPTEAEWEYAARYVDGRHFRRYAWGDSLPPPANAENLAGSEINAGVSRPERLQPVLPGHVDEHVVVAPVGSYGRSALGFADMGGNVSEWTHDVYSSLLSTMAVEDPRGDTQDGAHVIRGANWRSMSVQELRLAWRDRATGAHQTLGFRVARNVEASP